MTSGRIVMRDDHRGGKKSTAGRGPKLCGGCGVEIVGGGGGGGRGRGDNAMEVGDDAAGTSRGSKKNKAAYADALESAGSNFLCDRCKSLRRGRDGVWGAYDALRDVGPEVFKKQLQYIVKRRQFGLCIKVVDAADLEGSIVRGIRDSVGSTPLILAVNKIDLLPRPVTHRDLNYMKHRFQKRGVRCIGAHAVSAKTGEGVADLAERVLSDLGGRDVFVVGAANVGKSSLVKSLTEMIADSIKFSGKHRQTKRRKDAVTQLEPTVSHLPGTTLQAIRIPCFSSHRHALWDTPGIINDASLSYHIFPPHLMEPLARPDPIEARPPVYVRPGQSALMEASWMAPGCDGSDASGDGVDGDDHRDDDTDSKYKAKANIAEKSPPVLARLDVIASEYGSVEVRAFVPPCIGVRVVPTSDAPGETVIAESVLAQVREMVNLPEDDRYVKELVSFAEMRPSEDDRGNFTADVAFASLGWLSVYSRRPYTLDPKCVKGSRFFKREPRMYLHNFEQYQQDRRDEEDQDDRRQRLARAAREGRHLANNRRREERHGSSHDEDEWAQF